MSNQVESRASAKRGAAAVRAAVKRYSNKRRAFKLVLQPGGTLQAWVPGGRGPRCAAALRAPLRGVPYRPQPKGPKWAILA